MSSRRPYPRPPALHICGALLVGPLAVGCQERSRPWEGQEGPAVVLSAAPPRPVLPLAEPEPDAEGEIDGGIFIVPAPLPQPVRVGGPWVRCYGNFRLSGEPRKDLTRLTLLCGPANGMWRLSPQPIEGHVAEGQPGVLEKLSAMRGDCYRLFAVGGPGVINLDITLRSSRGSTIATDGSEDAWPILQPDRPFCPLENDTITVEIGARRGEGRFVAEIWVLRTPERHDLHTRPRDDEPDTYGEP